MAIRFLAMIFSLAAAALVGAALGTKMWYETSFVNGPVTTVSSYAPLYACTNDGTTDKCVVAKFSYSDAALTICTRKGSDMQLRFLASLALDVGGGFLSLVACILGVFNLRPIAIVRSMLALVGLAGIVAANVIYYLTIEAWMFCDVNFCKYLANFGVDTCSSKFGISFWINVAAAVVCLVGFIIHVISIASAGSAGTTSATEPSAAHHKEHPPHEDHHNPHVPHSGHPHADHPHVVHHDHLHAPAEHHEPAQARPEGVPEGDWAYDEETGYWWSDESQLFLHVESNQYYDPYGGQWYDPESETWYSPEE